ncbi:hypothetical protein ACFLYO_00920 [Chloroflexota bacterium]
MVKHIEFQPPDKATIRQYAVNVAGTLADKYNDEAYRSKETVQGLTDFFQIISWIETKALNADLGAVDNAQK